jgi:hypothetical protein
MSSAFAIGDLVIIDPQVATPFPGARSTASPDS